MTPTIPVFDTYELLQRFTSVNVAESLLGRLERGLNSIEPYFLFLDVLLLVVFLYSFYLGNRFRPDLGIRKLRGKKTLTLADALFKERWNDVAKRIASGTAEGLRLAIIEADKLADDALKRMGLPGEHMADRLDKINPDDLRSLDRLWRAHRIRNNVVHTPGFELSPSGAAQVLDDYESFFTEIGLLE